MRFAVALCATVLVACYQSANANQPGLQRTNSGQPRRSPAFDQSGPAKRPNPGQLPRPRSARMSPPSPSHPRMPSKITISGGQIKKTPALNPPQLSSSLIEPEPLPTQAISHLGKYSDQAMMAAQERFDEMDSGRLEKGLIHTELFLPLVERATKKFMKYRSWTNEQRKEYIRRKVAGQLSQMEEAYGKDFAEKILIRAMLDEGY